MEQTERTATTGLRRYGPGKFDTMLDAYVYDLSLNGCDEETGESETTGWYGLLRGLLIDEPFLECTLTAAEVDYVRAHAAGAIVSEDSQGFVHVEYFDTAIALDRAWQECVDATSTEDDESDEEEN